MDKCVYVCVQCSLKITEFILNNLENNVLGGEKT